MFTVLSPETFVALSIGLAIGLIILLALQIFTSLRVHRLTYPIYEYIQSKTLAEAEKVMGEAHEASQKIVADAQIAAATLLTKDQADIDVRTRAYQKTLEELSANAQRALEEGTATVRSAQEEIVKQFAAGFGEQSAIVQSSLGEIRKNLDDFVHTTQAQTNDMRRVLDEAGKGVAETLGRTFEGLSSDVKKRLDERMEVILKDAEEDVKTYRESRKRLVDEHMADLVAETSKVVLGKALTLDDHADLVEKALKEARAAGIL